MKLFLTYVHRYLSCEQGQSTVEAVLVALVFLSAVICLGALWRSLQSSELLIFAQKAGSHNLSEGVVNALKDLACF